VKRPEKLGGTTMCEELTYCATAIGSMPHPTAAAAVDTLFNNLPVCPAWPQLPRLNFRERMEVQFTEGLPCIKIDEERQRIFVDTADERSCMEAIGRFYESYLHAEATDEWSAFRISPKYSAGIGAFEKRLKTTSVPLLKIQTTGPITMGMYLTDTGDIPIGENETFRDVLLKGMIAKCRWQLKKFAPHAEQILCFIDEPGLSVPATEKRRCSVTHESAVTVLNEMVDAVHAENALCGLHCCGRTDWSILIEAAVDIISFDACNFSESLLRYPRNLKKHPEEGGYIAWGIVPASTKFFLQIPDHLLPVTTCLWSNSRQAALIRNLSANGPF
jgi:hypothetical protein